MKHDKGYTFLYDFLFHVVMNSHPDARSNIEKKAVYRYANLSSAQQDAVDQMFGELFSQSFSGIFNVPSHDSALDRLRMMFSANRVH